MISETPGRKPQKKAARGEGDPDGGRLATVLPYTDGPLPSMGGADA